MLLHIGPYVSPKGSCHLTSTRRNEAVSTRSTWRQSEPSSSGAIPKAATCLVSVLVAGHAHGLVKRRALRSRRICRKADEVGNMTTGDFVPPIGPFCPFRSNFSESQLVNEQMQRLNELSAEIATGFAPIALNARMGQLPDPAIVKPLAAKLREAQDLYRVNLARSSMSDDFQGIEFYKQTEAMVIRRMGMNLEQLHAGVEWQLGGMLAYAEGRLPPPRPAGVTDAMLAKLTDATSPLDSMSTPMIRAPPFDLTCATMQSEVVQTEFEALTRDHESLIKLGETYGSFDGAGKAIFLDQLEAVEERWDILFTRLKLTGDLNPDYVSETAAFLQRINLSPAEFRQALKEAHLLMRKDAERLLP
mmetsp:Transcript_51367/g.94949  ORF Transcript_51367/g.94949 Transcript_51367/m.94949 type:complete len:361 (-) Transcript_51367:31-1113(-)